MAKINIISGIQISNNPRVVKEADALTEAGHEVEVFSSILNRADASLETALSKNKGWKSTPVIDNSSQSIAQQIRWFKVRSRRQLWNKIYRASGWGNVRQLGYAAPEMLSLCRQRNAALNIVHLEEALWVGNKLLNDGERVAIDVEDWYSEDLSSKDKKNRPSYLLQRWEKRLLRDSCYATTTSHVMGSALAKAYRCTAPRVIYNTFSRKERNLLDGKALDRHDHETPSIIWFSQTVGPDRGLEVLIDALPHINIPVQIHIRGNCREGYEGRLRSRMPSDSKHHLFFHPSVPHHQLLSRLAEHDIGYAGEISYCLNKNLTISNKLFQYLLSGLTVLASDTAGQKEIADSHSEFIHVFKNGSATDLAVTLNEMISNRVDLARGKQSALQQAESHYCWEESKQVLLSSVSEALSR
ncbi:MAG: glycosyl transferase family 1 [Planctomycetaceae bacterium]|nr:glycosyl transferase family 1 [Planctomycetaceae bacterium]|tara:strand:- start:203 stop:1441 length:1239 start_codon:yes stop_codon:yes gene_type:complete